LALVHFRALGDRIQRREGSTKPALQRLRRADREIELEPFDWSSKSFSMSNVTGILQRSQCQSAIARRNTLLCHLCIEQCRCTDHNGLRNIDVMQIVLTPGQRKTTGFTRSMNHDRSEAAFQANTPCIESPQVSQKRRIAKPRSAKRSPALEWKQRCACPIIGIEV